VLRADFQLTSAKPRAIGDFIARKSANPLWALPNIGHEARCRRPETPTLRGVRTSLLPCLGEIYKTAAPPRYPREMHDRALFVDHPNGHKIQHHAGGDWAALPGA